MKKFILVLSLFLPLAVLLTACNEKQQVQTNSDQLTIYTTVFPLQYFTEQIGGEFVNVETIYPPGADEHTFEPSQTDPITLADSDLFFPIGFGLEGFVENAKKTLKDEQVSMIATAENLFHHEEEHDDSEEEHHDESGHSHDIDPHVWIDPLYAEEMSSVIKDALIEKMPEHEETFTQNFEKLAADLDELNSQFETVIQSAKQKQIIVTHAAFGYWEHRYGIEQTSISGLSSSSEPSQRELETIISQADRDGLQYILFEQNVQSKLADVVKKEIGARALPIHNLGILTKENIENNETYFTLMEQNLESLKTALNP